MDAISRWSNRVSCMTPLFSSSLIAGPRSAVIQSRPADLMSAPMRASVIRPRSGHPEKSGGLFGDPGSPTSTTCSRPKRCLSLSICGASDRRIAGVTRGHLDGDGTAVGGAEQAVDDLERALLAI